MVGESMFAELVEDHAEQAGLPATWTYLIVEPDKRAGCFKFGLSARGLVCATLQATARWR